MTKELVTKNNLSTDHFEFDNSSHKIKIKSSVLEGNTYTRENLKEDLKAVLKDFLLEVKNTKDETQFYAFDPDLISFDD